MKKNILFFLVLFFILKNIQAQYFINFASGIEKMDYTNTSISPIKKKGLALDLNTGLQYLSAKYSIGLNGSFDSGFYNHRNFPNLDNKFMEFQRFRLKLYGLKYIFSLGTDFKLWVGASYNFQYQDGTVLYFSNSSSKNFSIQHLGIDSRIENKISILNFPIEGAFQISLPFASFIKESAYTLNNNKFGLGSSNFSLLGKSFWGLSMQSTIKHTLKNGNKLGIIYKWNHLKWENTHKNQLAEHYLGIFFNYKLN